jgi:hypothetical protein
MPVNSAPVVRPLVAADVAQVAALHETVFPRESGLSRPVLENYLADLFLNNPCFDDAMPSLVCEQAGRTVGFLGVLPSTMLWGKRRIRVAVSTQFMVHPQYRSGRAAFGLLNAYFSGPQDLSFTDGANESARKMWQAVGAVAPPIYNLHWLRILRPGAFALSRLARRRFLSLAARVVAPFVRPLDSLLAQLASNPLAIPTNDSDEPLTPDELVDSVRRFSGNYDLRPEYDDATVNWLLTLASRKDSPTVLRMRCVRDASNQIIGWYVYFLKPGGLSQVLQLGGTRQHIDVVIDHLFCDAFSHGALALVGRMEPDFAFELGAKGVVFLRRGSFFLCHSRQPELLDSIARGGAFLSRLEGECWIGMRLHERAGQNSAAHRVPMTSPRRDYIRGEDRHNGHGEASRELSSE